MPLGLPPATFAWVQPVPVPSGSTTVDAVATTRQAVNCQAWISTTQLGLGIDSDGHLEVLSCSTARPVACCGPVFTSSLGDVNVDASVDILDTTILRRLLAGLPVE